MQGVRNISQEGFRRYSLIFILIVLVLILAPLVLAASFDWVDQETGIIQIEEGQTHTYDFNVTTDESNVDYSVSLTTGGSTPSGITISSTGFFSAFFGTHYLGKTPSFVYPGTGTILITAENISDEFDQIFSSVRFNITNTNGPPVLENCGPNSWNFIASNNDPDLRYWACDTTDAVSNTVVEGDYLYFNSTFRNFDPDPDNETTISWFKQVNGGSLEPITCMNSTGTLINQFTDSFYTEEDYFFKNCTVLFDASDAGFVSIISVATDVSNSSYSVNATWDFQVNNSNLPPYFLTNVSNPAFSGTYLGMPLITVAEGDFLEINTSYDDDDRGGNPTYEDFDVSAYWFRDALSIQNETSSVDYDDSFSEIVPFTRVVGTNDSTIFNYSVTISDTVNESKLWWYVNVTNVNQPPNITQRVISQAVINFTDTTFSVLEGDQFRFNFSYDDLDGDINYTSFRLNGTTLGSQSVSPFTGSFEYQDGTWNYSSAGVYNVSFYVNDSVGNEFVQNLILTVDNNTAPNITTFIVRNSTGGTDYFEGDLLNITFTYTDDRSDLDSVLLQRNNTILSSVTTGEGFSFVENLNYTIAGDYNISLRISDAEPLSALETIPITISPVEVNPSFVSIVVLNESIDVSFDPVPYVSNGIVQTREGEDIRFQITTTDLNGDDTVNQTNFTIVNLSEFYQINQSTTLDTGRFFLNYTSAGMHVVNVSVEDTDGNTNETFFYLNVTNNTAPVITTFNITNSTGGTEYVEGDLLNFTIVFADTFGADDVEDWQITLSGPISLTFSAANITKNGYVLNASYNLSETSNGVYNITATVTDGELLSDSNLTTITVIPNEVTPLVENVQILEADGTVIPISKIGDSVTVEEPNHSSGLNNLTYSFQATDEDGDLNTSSGAITINGTSYSAPFNGTHFVYVQQLNFSSQGVFTVSIDVYDDFGSKNDDFTPFTLTIINNTQPVVSDIVISALKNATHLLENDSIQFLIDVTDPNDNLISYNYYFNSTAFTNTTSASTSYSEFINYGEAGVFNITVSAIDTEGLITNFSKTFEVLRSNRTPVINYFLIDSENVFAGGNAPVQNEAVAIPFEANISDFDDDISLIEIRVDGVLENASCSKNTDLSSPAVLSCYWVPGDGDNGERNITLTIDDLGGLRTVFSENITIAPNSAPNITLFNVSNGGVTNTTFIEGETLLAQLSYTDANANVDNYTITLNTSGGDYVVVDTDMSYTFNFSERGTYNITAVVTDTFGLSDTQSYLITVLAREFNPRFEDLRFTLANGTVVTPLVGVNTSYEIKQNYLKELNNVTIYFEASDQNDNGTLTNYTVDLDSVFTNESFVGVNPATGSYFWNLSYAKVGNYTATITLYDDTGLTNTTQFTFTVLPNTPPSITFNSTLDDLGSETISENETMYVNFTAYDVDQNLDTLSLYFESVLQNFSSVETTNGSLTWAYYFNFTQAGTYNVTFVANDTAGAEVRYTDLVTVLATEVAPQITSVNLLVDSVDTGFSLGDSNITMRENQSLTINFTTFDENYDIDTLVLLKNNSQVAIETSDLELVYTWNTNYTDAGLYEFVAIVNDSTGNSTNTTFDVRILNNTIPQEAVFELLIGSQVIDNISVRADEGETLLVNVSVIDTANGFNNLHNLTVLVNGTIQCQNISANVGQLDCFVSWPIGYTFANNTQLDYLVEYYAYDEEGLELYQNDTVTIFHTAVAPVVTYSNVTIVATAQTREVAVSNLDTLFFNETDIFTYNFTASDVNGNETILNVTYTLFYANGSVYNQSNSSYGAENIFTWNTQFGDGGSYLFNATVFDLDGLMNTTLLTLNITNNTAPVVEYFTIQNQDLDNCEVSSTCSEGDNLTILFNASDVDHNIQNTTLYINNVLENTCTTLDNISVNCSYVWELNYTLAGVHNITFFSYDIEGLITNTTKLITIAPTQVAPEITYVYISSQNQNTSFNFTWDANFTNVSGVYELLIPDNITIHELDVLNISFGAFDINYDTLKNPRIRINTLGEGDIVTLNSSYRLYNYLVPSSLTEADTGNDGYFFELRVRDDPTDLTTTATVKLVIVNNTQPLISSFSIVNSTGGNLTYIEGDSLNITFSYSDPNNNIDTVELFENNSAVTILNNSAYKSLNLSSYGDYTYCLNITDTEPLATSSCIVVSVEPLNISPIILNYTVSNGTHFEISGGESISIVEGNELNFSVIASDDNGNNTIDYAVYRNGTTTPLLIGNTSSFTWDVNYTQEGRYNITLNLTTDRANELVQRSFTLDVINNTAPQITFFNITSNISNISQRDFVEGEELYLNFTYLDLQNNVDTELISVQKVGGSLITNMTTFWNYTIPIFQGNDLGKTVNYTVTFFVNDSQGFSQSIQEIISVAPKPEAPKIVNPRVLVNNGTQYTLTNNSNYIIFEGQTAILSFSTTDANNNAEVLSIFNGSTTTYNTTPSSINATFVTTFDTATQDYENVTLTYFVNDTTSLSTLLNFTLRVKNNTAPVIVSDQIIGNLLGSDPLENNTHEFRFSYIDSELNYDSVNISLYENVLGSYSYVNSTQFSASGSSDSFFHYFAIGERGDFRIIYTINDTQNLTDSTFADFEIVGNGAPPFIENISIESAFFGLTNLSDDDIYTTQEGDTVTINFSAYDIDDGDSIDTMSLRINGSTVASELILSTLSYPLYLDFDSNGIYTLSLVATDQAASSTIAKIYLNVSDNIGPTIDSLTVTNSSGNITAFFAEGDSMNISAIVSDVNVYDDFANYRMYLNDSLIGSSTDESYTWNYSSAGQYNLTFFVNDTEGLNDSASQLIFVSATEVAPIIQTVEYELNNSGLWIAASQLSSIYTDENIPFSVRLTATDQNEDAVLTYAGFRNATPLSGDETNFSWVPSFASQGNWTINVSVSDETGRTDAFVFYLDVADNTAPQIDSYYFLADNGTFTPNITENQSIEIFFNVSDVEGNIDTCFLEFNSLTTPCTGNEVNVSTFFAFLDTGVYLATLFVNDTEGLNQTILQNVTVSFLPRAPVIEYVVAYANGTSQVITGGETIYVNENRSISVYFNASDLNEDLLSLNITGGGFSNGVLYPLLGAIGNLNSTWDTNFTDAGQYEINLSAHDNSSLFSQVLFNVSVLNNTAPTIVTYFNQSGNEILSENSTFTLSFTYADAQSNAVASTELVCFDETCYSGTSTAIYLGFTDRGVHNITYYVEDEEGLALNYSHQVTVSSSNQPPTITNLYVFDQDNPTIYNVVNIAESGTFVLNTTENSRIGFDIEATDINGDALTYNTTINSTPPSYSSVPEFTWNIGFGQDGLRIANVTVSDGILKTSYVLFINITENTAPEITSLTFVNSTGGTYLREGDVVTVTATATDVDGNLNTLRLFRDGVQQKIVSGSPLTFTYATDYNDRGTYNFSVNATDTANAYDFIYNDTVYINAVELPPDVDVATLTQSGNITTIVDGGIYYLDPNSLARFDFSASDQNAPFSTIERYVLFENSTLLGDSATGSNLYSYTPLVLDDEKNFSFVVNDSTSLNTSLNFTIRVGENTAPNITSLLITDFNGGNISENDTIGITFSFDDLEGDVNIIAIYYDDVLIGSANQTNYTIPFQESGDHNITLYLEDYDGFNDTQVQVITVDSVNVAPTIDSVTITPSGENPIFPNQGDVIEVREGQEVNILFTASDLNGNGSIIGYNITRNGTIINQSNVGEWAINYSSAGLWNISLFVTDGEFDTTFNITFNVTDNLAPVITNISFLNSFGNTTDFVGRETIYLDFNATDVDDTILSYAIYLDNTSNIISSTKTKTYVLDDLIQGEHSFIFVVSDIEGLNDTQIGYFNATARNVAPTITNLTLNNSLSSISTHAASSTITIRESTQSRFSFSANDANNDVLTYTLTIRNASNTSQIIASSATNSLVWDASYASNETYTISARATDGYLSRSVNYTLLVLNNTAPIITSNITLNSTGGTIYREGDMLNLTLTHSNYEDDIAFTSISLQGTEFVLNQTQNQTVATFDLNYTMRGDHNISVILTDGEGLSDTLLIPVTIDIVNVSPVILPKVRVNAVELTPVDGGSINISEDATIILSFEAIDYNGNHEINYTNLTLNGITSANTTSTSFVQSASAFVNHTVTYSVTSVYGEVVTMSFTLNQTPSVGPTILAYNFTNQTNGYAFSQNESLNFTSIILDPNNDIVSYLLYFNVTGNMTLWQSLSSENQTLTIPADVLGNVNMNYTVVDASGFSDSVNFTIFILPTNITPQVTNPLIETQSITEGASLVYDYSGSTAEFSFVGIDANGNDTILETGVIFTLANGTKFNSTSNTSSFSYDLTVTDALEGVQMMVSYFVTDDTFLTDEFNFSIILRSAQVQTVTAPRSSTGGGGGGGSSAPPPPKKIPKVDFKPILPLALNPNSETIQTITITNSGEERLTNVLLTPRWTYAGVEVEILDSYNSTLGLNESITVRVLVKNPDTIEGYNVSFDLQGNVGGTTKLLTDSAVLYVNTLAKNADTKEDEYQEIRLFVSSLLEDDIRCLELVDFLTDAELLFVEGNVQAAIDLLNDVKVRCLESSQKSFDALESVILYEDTGIRTLVLQIIGFVVAAMLILPPIFIFIRHRKGKNVVDKKEEQIEEWLDEFYK